MRNDSILSLFNRPLINKEQYENKRNLTTRKNSYFPKKIPVPEFDAF